MVTTRLRSSKVGDAMSYSHRGNQSYIPNLHYNGDVKNNPAFE
jgi:hypothetical protein